MVLPLLDGTSNATLLTLTLMFTSVGVAINWNLTGGFTGYVDFGHAVWFGIGAYTTAIMMSLQANGLGIGWPPVPAMALGAAVAGALGLGTVAGPVVGSVGLYWLREVLWANLLDYHLIAQGVLLILIVLFLPRGIVGLFDRRGASVRHLWRVRRPPAADRPEEAGT